MNSTLTCAFAQWGPGLGDNNIMGWVTVAVYLLAAVVTVRLARLMGGPDPAQGRERSFWAISAAIMLFLAVNKQLDLQSLFTMIGRCHAQLSGWYGMRRSVQQVFILSVAGLGAVAMILLGLLLRGVLHRVWPAMLGMGFVCGFVLIRAASFHHMDGLIGSWTLGVKVNWLLELPGPSLVALVAWTRRRRLVAG